MADLLYRLGHVAVRRKWVVIALWLVALSGATVLNFTFDGKTDDTFAIPGSESQKAFDLLDERFPAQSGSTAQLVFASSDGTKLTDPGPKAAIESALTDIGGQPGVASVSDPFESGAISNEGTIGYAQVRYPVAAEEVGSDAFDRLTTAIGKVEGVDVRTELGGDVVDANGPSHGMSSELIGLGVAVVVLLISFGSLLAMGLPIITALIGVGIGLMGTGILSAFMDLSSAGPTLALMIGLAVGIDYALFIVTRHRQNLHQGLSVEEAAARANTTAGGAVVFAGMTVVIALASLVVVGVPLLTGMGIAAGIAVTVAVLVAITLMPALLGVVGHHIDRFKVPGLKTTTGAEDDAHRSFSARWATQVTKRPAISLAAGATLMLLLTIPLLDLRLGMSDDGSKAPDSTERQAYDLLGDGFGPGFNGPLVLVTDLTGVTDPDAAIAQITEAVAADPGIVTVAPATLNPTGDTAVLSAIPTSGPSTKETEQLVHRLRNDVLPSAEERTGAEVQVTGSTAANIDISEKIGNATPMFMAMVIGLTMILLLVVFRSIVVPIKAAIAILLSIGASFGVIVAVFQWGWFADIIGIDQTGPIISFLPIMMFAILFGLSMDYEVFILSRIREDFSRTGDAHRSVLTGLASSARVITAAALIMISVFASFMLGDETTIKMFGLGLSAAVLLDATVVRMLIVPAVMSLFGDRAWWLPRRLDRIIPDLDVEGEALMHRLEGHDRNASHNGTAEDGTEPPKRELIDIPS